MLPATVVDLAYRLSLYVILRVTAVVLQATSVQGSEPCKDKFLVQTVLKADAKVWEKTESPMKFKLLHLLYHPNLYASSECSG